MFKPLYEDDSIRLIRDYSLVPLTSTNTLYIGGSSFTILIPIALSAVVGTVTLQANNTNIASSTTGSNPLFYNKLMQRPGAGRWNVAIESSFSSSWANVTTVTAGFNRFSDTPVRYIRLNGFGVSALDGSSSASFDGTWPVKAAYVWVNTYTQGV